MADGLSISGVPIRAISRTVVVSREVLNEQVSFWRQVQAEVDRLSTMTPEQIAAEREARDTAEREAREAVMAAAQPVPLALDSLLARLGWSEEYARHLVQSYCTCDPFGEDPTLCGFAEDEGVSR